MAIEYDSDSSAGDDIETGVTLGYASKESTEDDFSRLGGHPSWLDGLQPPPGTLSKCKSCHGLLSLLLQLNGDLPDRFAGHERRLYIFACRRKACRRKDGSIRGIRSTKINSSITKAAASKPPTKDGTAVVDVSTPSVATNLGNTLFGAKIGTGQAFGSNPFGTTSVGSSTANPFAPKAAKEAEPSSATTTTETLSQTFAQKAQIGADKTQPVSKIPTPNEPWPKQAAFPQPYPSYYIDADKEFLEPEQPEASQATQIIETEADGEGSGGVDVKDAFESSMDKTFQRFADRMSQNPEQVLRYDFGGQPLLYSKTDAVGKLWPRTPKCAKCGAGRTFELQLTPHAITELEVDDISLEGMDWGTIILAVCAKDCEGWNEEWIGAQWEELAGRKPA